MMDGGNGQSGQCMNANSIKITDVTEDGDTLTFAITSLKLGSSNGICVFKTFEDFDQLQQSLFSQEDVAGLHGVIFPPLPAKPLPSSTHTQAKALKQLGFLALGDNWLYCKALEFYLQQVAAHSILGKSKLLHSFLSSTEPLGKQRGKKGIFERLSQAMEELRKEGHKDVDEFFQNERESNTHVTALFKTTTEKFLDVVLTKQRLALACGHFSTSLHLCVNQDNPSAVAFSKICVKLSDVMDAVKRNLDKVVEDDVCTLGLGLDFESRYQEAKREMLFRRTCKLVELENIIKNAEKAKPNKKAFWSPTLFLEIFLQPLSCPPDHPVSEEDLDQLKEMDGVQKITQKEFNLISSMAKEEIEWYSKARVSVMRDFLTHWCEKQLDTARESATLFSQHLEAWKGLPV